MGPTTRQPRRLPGAHDHHLPDARERLPPGDQVPHRPRARTSSPGSRRSGPPTSRSTTRGPTRRPRRSSADSPRGRRARVRTRTRRSSSRRSSPCRPPRSSRSCARAAASNPPRPRGGTVPRSAFLRWEERREGERLELGREMGGAPRGCPRTLLPGASAAARVAAICGLGDGASPRTRGTDGVERKTGDRRWRRREGRAVEWTSPGWRATWPSGSGRGGQEDGLGGRRRLP